MDSGRRTATALAALVLSLTGSARAGELERFEYSRIRMGIPFNITVYASDEASANRGADAAYRRIKELNGVFSDYHPQSETNRLVRDATVGTPFPVSRDLVEVLARARRISEASDGAFDVTVSPAVKLWRRAWRTKEKPTDEAIAEARALIGYESVQIDRRHATVTLARPGIQLDFGGIAKGYACDEAIAVLKKHGITRTLVEAGGDLACSDPPPGKIGWTIAIELLAEKSRSTAQLLSVQNCGVATSGDAYQFIEFDGVRYSHVVDPRTGLGLTTHSSATVIAKDGTAADALASAVSVLGPEKGKELIESIDRAEMRMVTVSDDGMLRRVTTAGFERHVVKSP